MGNGDVGDFARVSPHRESQQRAAGKINTQTTV